MIQAYDPVAGLTIIEALQEAIQIAKSNNCKIRANINDIEILVTKDTSLNDVCKEYQQKLRLKYQNSRTTNTR